MATLSTVKPEPSLLDAIAGGGLDDHLGAIEARRRLLYTVDSSHALASLCVRIPDNISPRYLAGIDGTVIELDDVAVTIRLERPVGRFRGGCVRWPPLALEKLG